MLSNGPLGFPSDRKINGHTLAKSTADPLDDGVENLFTLGTDTVNFVPVERLHTFKRAA